MQKTNKFILLSILAAKTYANNPFTFFDNNISIGYQHSNIQDTAILSSVHLNANLLLNNNLYLNGLASALLEYNLSNNNRGLNNLYQNKSGGLLALRGGYALNYKNYNFIPYLGFAYSNLLIAYNQDSTQQFIFENPAYNLVLGTQNEWILIDKTLKLSMDAGLAYSTHKAVLPNTDNTLGHVNYTNYLYTLSPSLQYIINQIIDLEVYYTLSGSFATSGRPTNVYYPGINVDSANVINTNNLTNTLGFRFGVVF